MNNYIDKVLSGDIPACSKIKQACKRHTSDLKRSKQKGYPYYFNEKEALKAIKFLELLPSTDGSKIKMLGFQKFIIGSLYGWREKQTNNRRFNKAFISVARKSGKTFLASGIGAYGLVMENEPAEGRQVLFTANSNAQARLGYSMLMNGLRKAGQQSKFMRQQFKINNSRITHLPSNSFAVALASDTSSLDGFAPTISIVDEFHEAKDKDVYNVLNSGMAQQKNGLLAIISTAGFHLQGPMYEEYQFLSKVLEGTEEAERYFVGIWELDSEEEAHKTDMYIKANPILEHAEINDTMTKFIQDDVELAIKQDNLNAVLVKNFNMWRQASEDSYITSSDWERNKVAPIDIKSKEVYIGIDLSATGDLTSVSWLIPIENQQFYCDSRSWVATKYGLEQKIKRDGINYRDLESKGLCSITKLESGVIDYEDMFQWIMNFIEMNELDVKAICYDPWGSQAFISKAEKVGLSPLIEVRQGTFTLSGPIKDFREKVFDNKIVHSNNSLLNFAVCNAILIQKNNTLILNKDRPQNRIDPLAALITGYTEAMYHYETEERSKADNDLYKSENFGF